MTCDALHAIGVKRVRPLAFGLAGFFAKDWSMQIPLGHGRFAEIALASDAFGADS